MAATTTPQFKSPVTGKVLDLEHMSLVNIKAIVENFTLRVEDETQHGFASHARDRENLEAAKAELERRGETA